MARIFRILVCLAVAAVLQPVAASAAKPAGTQSPSVSRAQLGAASQDLSLLAGHDPHVTVETLKLPSGFCQAVNAAHPGAAPNCMVLHYSYAENHVPAASAPRAQTLAFKASSSALSAIAPGYWYWSYRDQVCAPTPKGPACWLYSDTMTEDGVANGTNVWQWDHGCTASGYGASTTWCGFQWNGGGAPTYRMQFGSNFNICVGPQNIGCFGHGIRRDIDDSGNPGALDVW